VIPATAYVFSNANVYAFEQDARAASKFKSNPTDRRVRPVEIAAGAQGGLAEFNVGSVWPAPSRNMAGNARPSRTLKAFG
jgi:hypothetical protein